MHTEIIERRPPKTDHGILGRARSAAALALTPKPNRNVKKSVAKVWTTFCTKNCAKNCQAFLARPWRHYGIPTQNQKTYQKSLAKNAAKFRAKNCPQNCHGKIAKKIKNMRKTLRRRPQIPRGKLRGGRARKRHVNLGVELHIKVNYIRTRIWLLSSRRFGA